MQKLLGALLPARFPKMREPVLNDVTLWLGRGETFAVIGEQGAGKTALLRVIAGMVLPERGSCTVTGKVAAAIGMDSLLLSETGEGNARMQCAKERLGEAETRRRIEAVRAFSGLGGQFLQPAAGYETAARARLILSIALTAEPDVLLISDVLDKCDLPFVQACVLRLRQKQRGGMTLLMESGDFTLLRRLCESALWLEKGELKRVGPFETVYAAFSRKRRVPAVYPLGTKRALRDAQVAFSDPLSPDSPALFPQEADVDGWPAEAQRMLREMEAYCARLDEQLTAYAQANLAFERENARQEELLHQYEARLQETDLLLSRMMAALAETTGVMHAQFVHLQGQKKPTKRKLWGSKKKKGEDR
ncbi:MAG TPA: ATP-binding cassette domain-containing protein [Feifaniaceae bacterium]|nr:ATP-binding cassette domain-containing protein [Feifaniaceae bacterium]